MSHLKITICTKYYPLPAVITANTFGLILITLWDLTNGLSIANRTTSKSTVFYTNYYKTTYEGLLKALANPLAWNSSGFRCRFLCRLDIIRFIKIVIHPIISSSEEQHQNLLKMAKVTNKATCGDIKLKLNAELHLKININY